MAENTNIEWADGSWSPWEGCEKVSPGCKFCYAEQRDKQYHAGAHWGTIGVRKMMSESYWQKPLAWNRKAAAEGKKLRIFASLCDPFENRPEMIHPRHRFNLLIEATPHLTWLLLTKRPENVADSVPVKWLFSRDWPSNVRLGVSVENQEWADKRREAFAALPGSKFVCYEPALGPVDWTGWEFVDQFISGGESGKDKGIRPSHPDWHRATRDWCKANGKAYFFKQWGEFGPRIVNPPVMTEEGMQFPDKEIMTRFGKKAAGRLLDGREWSEIPGINFPVEAE